MSTHTLIANSYGMPQTWDNPHSDFLRMMGGMTPTGPGRGGNDKDPDSDLIKRLKKLLKKLDIRKRPPTQ